MTSDRPSRSRTPLEDTTNLYLGVTRQALYVGLAVAGVFGAFTVFSDWSSGSFEIETYLQAVLIAVVVLLGFLWANAGLTELHMVSYWLRDGKYAPPGEWVVRNVILGIGVAIGALVGFTFRMGVFGIAYTLYLMLDVYFWVIRRSEFRKKIKSQRSFSEPRLKSRENLVVQEAIYVMKGVDVIESFYIDRPHILRCFCLALASLAVITLHYCTLHLDLRWNTGALYVSYIALVLIGEVVICRWRVVRDRSLRGIRETLESATDED